MHPTFTSPSAAAPCSLPKGRTRAILYCGPLRAGERVSLKALSTDVSLAQDVRLSLERSAWILECGRPTQENRQAPQTLIPCRQLYDAATAQGLSQTEELWGYCTEQGRELAPQGQHMLVFACCRWASAGEAQDRLLTFLDSGSQVLPETYLLVILAHLQEANLDAAKDIYNRLMRAQPSQQGWLAMVEALFAEGYGTEGLKLLAKGQTEDAFEPSTRLNQLAFEFLCSSSRTYPLALDMYKDAGCRGLQALGLETAHVNTLLLAMARFHIGHKLEPSQPEKPTAFFGDGVLMAEQLLGDMLQGKMGERGRPDTNSFNALIEACILARDAGHPEGENRLDALKGRMYLAQLRPNRRTHALYVEAFTDESRLQHAMRAFEEMLQLGTPGNLTTALSPGALGNLLAALAANCRPSDMWRVIQAAAADGTPFAYPGEETTELTPATSWLPAAMLLQQHAQGSRELPQEVAIVEEATYTDADGNLISSGGIVVDEEGTTVPVSKMTLGQLRAELLAKGLSLDGKRQDMYRRVQAARQSATPDSSGQMQAQTAKRISSMRELFGETSLDGEELLGEGTMAGPAREPASGTTASAAGEVEISPRTSSSERSSNTRQLYGDRRQERLWLAQKLHEEELRLQAEAHEMPIAEAQAGSGRLGQLSQAEVRQLKAYLARMEHLDATAPGASIQGSLPEDESLTRLAYRMAVFLNALGCDLTAADWLQVAKCAAMESQHPPPITALGDEELCGCGLSLADLGFLRTALQDGGLVHGDALQLWWAMVTNSRASSSVPQQ